MIFKYFPTCQVLCIAFVCFMVACGNAFEETNRNDDLPNETGPTVFYTGFAMLGPLAAADVEVYQWPEFYAAPIYSTVTQGAESQVIGQFQVPDTILQDDGLYLIKVSGGNDFDANGDGVIDALPAPNQGVLHAVITTDQIIDNEFSITVLSELVYQRMRYVIASGQDSSGITNEIRRLTNLLIKSDINGDMIVNGDDLLKWRPLKYKNVLFLAEDDFIPVTDKIRTNASIAKEVASLTDYEFASFRGTAVNSIVNAAIHKETYLATDATNGLFAFNITDPIHAEEILAVNSVTDKGLLRRILVEGDMLYAATGDSGVRSYNLNQTIYQLVGNAELPLASGPPEVFIKNAKTLYVFQSDQFSQTPQTYLHLFNIGGDQAIVFVSTLTLPISQSVLRVGNYLYLASQNTLRVVDVSLPDSPLLLDTQIDVTAVITDMEIKDQAIIATTESNGVMTLDIANPEVPVVNPTNSPNIYAFGVSVSGNFAFINSQGIQVFDVSDPKAMRWLGKLPSPGIDKPPSGKILFKDEYVFLPLSFSTLVSTLRDPGDGAVSNENFEANAFYSGLNADGLLTVCTVTGPTGQYGITLYNTSTPGNPQKVSTIPLPELCHNAIRNGNFLYVANGRNGIAVINIENPAAAFVVKTIDANPGTNDGAKEDFALFSNFLFVADLQTGLRIYNVSTPDTPVLASVIPSLIARGQVSQLVMKDNTLILMDQSKVIFVNVSNPALINETDIQNFIVKEVPLTGFKNDIRVFGDYLFVSVFGSSNYEIATIDISSIASATEVSRIPAALNAFSTYFDGRYLFVASNSDGIWIYDYEDKSNPSLQTIIQTPGFANDIINLDGFLYLSDNTGGLRIYQELQHPL